jgi:hypothetical protein
MKKQAPVVLCAVMVAVLVFAALPTQAAVTLVPPQGLQATEDYKASNAGIPNVQASRSIMGGATDNAGVCKGTVTYNLDHGESDLAVDPLNPNHLLGASKFFFDDNQYIFHVGSYVSLDGGASFPGEQIVPFYDCVTSGNVKQWQNSTDPTVAFDGQGGAYTLVLAFNWSSTNVPDAVISVSKSTDGGTAWGTPITLTVEQSAALGDSLDKQWITAHGSNVFAAWAVFDGHSVVVKSSFSHDAGKTWSKAAQLTSPSIDQAQNTDVYPRFAPDGTLYVPSPTFRPSSSRRAASRRSTS